MIRLKTEVLDLDIVDMGDMEERDVEEEMEEGEEEEEEEMEVWRGGEGGRLVHGKAILSTTSRGDLFSPDLETKVELVFCNCCGEEMVGLSDWRSHCLGVHGEVHGYGPVLVREEETLVYLTPNKHRPFQCTRCRRCKLRCAFSD